MANATLNLNMLGSAAMGENPKVRVRVSGDSVVQIKPTDRVSDRCMPKGEMLVELRTKRQGSGQTIRFGLPDVMVGDYIGDGNFRLEELKHGWFEIVTCAKPVPVVGQPQPAGGSVSDR